MKTILVIEDDIFFQKFYANKLSEKGYKVEAAINGIEGLEKLKKGNIDLVLLDLVMPRVNGFTVLVKLKGDSKTMNIPVIILTAKTEAEYALDAGRLGASDYLVKPPSMQAIIDMVSKYIV